MNEEIKQAFVALERERENNLRSSWKLFLQ
jgi:hypothetical protein